MMVKYMTHELLTMLNLEAIRLGFKHTLKPEWVRSLDRHILYPIISVLPGQDEDTAAERVTFSYAEPESRAMLDMTCAAFDQLPEDHLDGYPDDDPDDELMDELEEIFAADPYDLEGAFS